MKRIELGGTWTLIRLADGSKRPMEVPGDIMSALLASGEIPDPYFGENEALVQWVGREDWLLERDFELPVEDLAWSSLCLEALSLDTLARVEVNGHLVGQSANMFRRFRAEVGDCLKGGSNNLRITILSPENYAKAAAERLPYPIPASQYPVTSPHRNLLRKAQCMAGWDWGPCIMTGGIYDGIALLAHDGPRIEALSTRTRRGTSRGSWEVDLRVETHGSQAAAQVRARLAGAEVRGDIQADGTASLHLDLEGIEDWNPAGYGRQPLYDLEVQVIPGGQEAGTADRGWSERKRLGFRDLRVLSEEDQWGRSMKFQVNGREIFAKGANWIPADALPSRWTRERYADLLGSAVAANMNMLRVWGGGRYEGEAFYELCDELGILLWQDCMFSCALYPSSPEFLGEVEAEIGYQVRRLQDHPSLALWCGNNEALGAITWYEESKKSPARYIVDYDRLTEGVLGRVVRSLDPDRTWWPSSPSAGPNDYSDNWHADGRGDMHYWTVWHEGRPFSAYLEVEPRFCSEFGFQSLPSLATVGTYARPEDWNVTSPVMEHHQRHPRGNALIVETMLRYFPMPSGFAQTLYLSQVQQALAIRTAVEFWRSRRPRSMGALYWQLNDVWPVASWSSLEHDGSWKILHHEARRFFEALHLAFITKDGAIKAALLNDGAEALGGSLELRLLDFGGRVLWTATRAAEVAADGVAQPWEAGIPELEAAAGLSRREVYLEGSFACRTRDGRLETRKARTFLTEPKSCGLRESGLEFRVTDGPSSPRIALRTTAPAFFVAPELDPASGLAGRFSDSGFDLSPGEEATLTFAPKAGSPCPSAQDLAAALRFRDLGSLARHN